MPRSVWYKGKKGSTRQQVADRSGIEVTCTWGCARQLRPNTTQSTSKFTIVRANVRYVKMSLVVVLTELES